MFSCPTHYKHLVSAAMASADEPLLAAGITMLQNYADDDAVAGPSQDTQVMKFAEQSAVDAQVMHCEESLTLNLLELPQEILHNILRYMSYAELSRIRITCHGMKLACSCVLNQGFQKIQSRIQKRFQNIKSQMPRRESARRKHPLARECDIMETLHMRMALLHMTFGRRIERGHCCFFAGEVLDEVLRILDYVTNTTNIGRAYKVTDELFDLSTMAMEYFKEKVEPTFPEINTLSPDYIPIFSTPKARPFLEALKPANETDSAKLQNSPSASSPVLSPPPSAVSNRKIKVLNNDVRKLRRSVSVCMRKMSSQRSQLRDSTSKLEQQDRKIEEQNRRIEALITELHQCQSDIRQLQTPCKDRAGVASLSAALPSSSVPASEAKCASTNASLPQTQSSDNTQKRPASPSIEESNSPVSKKRKI